jgi:DtxR family Mn-dependent transcriptional regulator
MTNGDRPGVHPPNEQYLEAIFNLEEEGNQVIQARLAERVGHSAPTVSEMVHRLREAGHITVHGRSLSLTPAGRELAIGVIRKHRLAERLLTEVIGLPWHKVHAEADRWEHVISDDVEARLVKILGNPATCPHGNVIPGSGYEPQPCTVLAEARVGDRVQLVRVAELLELDMDGLEYLEEHGFIPGCKATVAAQGPDGSLVLETEDKTVVLGSSFANLLYFSLVAREEVADAGTPGSPPELLAAGTDGLGSLPVLA